MLICDKKNKKFILKKNLLKQKTKILKLKVLYIKQILKLHDLTISKTILFKKV